MDACVATVVVGGGVCVDGQAVVWRRASRWFCAPVVRGKEERKVWLSKPGGVMRERWFLICMYLSLICGRDVLGFAVYNLP
jgi:hypothetical protein